MRLSGSSLGWHRRSPQLVFAQVRPQPPEKQCALDYAATNATDGNLTISLANTEAAVAVAHYSMSTKESVQAAMTTIDRTLERLSQEHGYVGAMLTRFTTAAEHADASASLRAEAVDRINSIDVAK